MECLEKHTVEDMYNTVAFKAKISLLLVITLLSQVKATILQGSNPKTYTINV